MKTEYPETFDAIHSGPKVKLNFVKKSNFVLSSRAYHLKMYDDVIKLLKTFIYHKIIRKIRKSHDNVVVLSLPEGNVPKSSSGHSCTIAYFDTICRYVLSKYLDILPFPLLFVSFLLMFYPSRYRIWSLWPTKICFSGVF